jgi:hypothetical protein
MSGLGVAAAIFLAFVMIGLFYKILTDSTPP